MSDALRGHIEDAVADTSDKYFADAIEATGVLSRESFLTRATISMHVGRGIHVQAHQEADDPYVTFDIALAHLAKRLRDHHKERETVEAARTAEYIIAPLPDDDDTNEDTANNDNPVIIAENQTSIETLTVSEAVMRMDLADAPALLFRNAKHDGLSVIYRRADGNVGWIDTSGDAA